MEVYGSDKADKVRIQFERLMPYMTDPQMSFCELVERSFYKRSVYDKKRRVYKQRSLTESSFKLLLRSRHIDQILADYVDRIKTATLAGRIDIRIVPGDIADVIKLQIFELDNPPLTSGGGGGRRVYTGQRDRPGSRPGYNSGI